MTQCVRIEPSKEDVSRLRWLPWLRRVLRIGFASRGVFYLLIAVVTLLSLAQGGRPGRGVDGTFEVASQTRPGMLLLSGLCVCFTAFAFGLWWVALLDWNGDGATSRGLARRSGAMMMGLAHLVLAMTFLLVVLGHQTNLRTSREWAARVLGYPMGRAGLLAAGLWVIGFSLFLMWQALTARLDPHLDLSRVGRAAARCAMIAGRAGVLARAAICAAIGGYLLQAGWQGDASHLIGLGGALRTFNEGPHGRWALTAVASGLGAYGAFMIVEARHRRIAGSH